MFFMMVCCFFSFTFKVEDVGAYRPLIKCYSNMPELNANIFVTKQIDGKYFWGIYDIKSSNVFFIELLREQCMDYPSPFNYTVFENEFDVLTDFLNENYSINTNEKVPLNSIIFLIKAYFQTNLNFRDLKEVRYLELEEKVLSPSNISIKNSGVDLCFSDSTKYLMISIVGEFDKETLRYRPGRLKNKHFFNIYPYLFYKNLKLDLMPKR